MESGGPDNNAVIDKTMIDDFLQHKIEFYQIAAKTYTDYTLNLGTFSKFINSHGYNMLNVTKEIIIEYKKGFPDARPDTLRTYFAAIRSFYKWATAESTRRMEKSPMPEMRLARSPPHPNFIPTSKQFFEARLRVKSATDAALLECFASSGMRLEELLQVRACDVQYDRAIQDFELRMMSPYIGASIQLTQSTIHTKGNKSRVVFLSKLAVKMLRLHIRELGIPANSNLPLFPFSKNAVCNRITRIGVRIAAKAAGTVEKPVRRRPGFLDIDISKLEGNDAYKQMVVKAQESEKLRQVKEPHREKAYGLIKPRKINLHPHCLRHFFAMCQYYRNYYGNRRDLITLRDLMGHSSIKQSEVYLTCLPVCENDRQWRQVYCGNGFDYTSIIRNYADE